MMLIFLTSVRVQFKEVFQVVLEAVLIQSMFIQALQSASAKVEVFTAVLQQAFLHARIERNPLPRSVFSELVDDYVHLVNTFDRGDTQFVSFDGERPAFHGLLTHLLGVRAWGLLDLTTDEETAAELLQQQRDRALVEEVVSARRRRTCVRKDA
jgi:hypothetical protein